MKESSIYSKRWDQYYSNLLNNNKNKALWDVPAEKAVIQDFELFGNYFDKSLAIIDLGCGTGTQTVFLSSYYLKVIGLDVSNKAIEYARKINKKKNIEFNYVKGNESAVYQQIHNKYGDSNIYMRGVLHQILSSDVSPFIDNLKKLLGKKGCLFLIEVSESIREYFSISSDEFSKLPDSMKKTFLSHLPPKGMSLEKIQQIFSDDSFSILNTGSSSLLTNLHFKDKSPIKIPAIYALIQPIQ